MADSFTARPVAGRLIALDLHPTRPLTWLGPVWAALCGAIASGGLAFRGPSILALIFSLLLCDVLLGSWRALWLSADWRTALPRNIAKARVLGSYSDYETTSLIARWSRGLNRPLTFMRHVILPLVDSEIIAMLLAGVLSVCIAIVLGQLPLILTLSAMVLALIEGQVGPQRGMGLRAIVEMALPWLIAQTALGSFSWLALFYALLFTLVYRALLGLAVARPEHWVGLNNLMQVLLVVFLVASNTPVGAGVVALGLLAQILWQMRYQNDRDGRTYIQRVQSYVLVGMFIAGLSLWL
jgi:hypothetical protein